MIWNLKIGNNIILVETRHGLFLPKGSLLKIAKNHRTTAIGTKTGNFQFAESLSALAGRHANNLNPDQINFYLSCHAVISESISVAVNSPME